MLTSWIRKIGSARLVALAIVSLFLGSAAMPAAEARFGRSSGGSFRSFGNRGSRTFGSGSPNSRMAPVSPSPFGNRNNGFGANGAGQANRGSWFQRNPLMSGLIGAVAGTVLGSMLMNALGGAGGLGSFLMIAMLGVGALVLFGLFRMFTQKKQPSFATGGGGPNYGAAQYSGGQSFGSSNS